MGVFTELTAGGVAGAIGIIATQPMDTIRVRLQNQHKGQRYSGILDVTMSTLRAEGIRGLYKGVASPVLTVGLMNAVLFFSYESAVSTIKQTMGGVQELSLPQVFVAGSLSGVASAFVTAPTELVKCIAQTNLKSEGKMREEYTILRNMIKHEGWTGAHGPSRGLGLTICRDSPSFGLYFVVYEGICRHFGKSDTVSFYAGGFAGVAAWSCIYPIDVIKTRWQTAAPGTFRSLTHVLQSGLKAEGPGFLLSGYSATMLRAWPQNAVIFWTYERVSRYLDEPASQDI
jgi:solute carrier family 25 carnitine/acylcarnitine transporter 20/29